MFNVAATRRKERKTNIMLCDWFYMLFSSKFVFEIYQLNWFRCGAWVASDKLIYIYSMLFMFTSLIVWNVFFFSVWPKFWCECVYVDGLNTWATIENWLRDTKKTHILTEAHFVAGVNQCQARDKIKAFHYYLWHIFFFRFGSIFSFIGLHSWTAKLWVKKKEYLFDDAMRKTFVAN